MDKLKEVLEEVPKVRKDLGYPPLVTPTSQLVGTQAVFNVLAGERYKIVPKEVKDYIKGLYGKPPAPINKEVKKKTIGDEEAITQRPADLLKPQLNAIPEEVRQLFEKEEDALTYALFPQPAIEFFKKRKQKREEKALSVSEEERKELEEAAAVSTAIAAYLQSTKEVMAVIPSRKTKKISPWGMAGRQELTRAEGLKWGTYSEGI